MARTPHDARLPTIVAIILGLTALRLIGLAVSPVNLHGDEAQYWSWAQSLELGYFSKPPLIAWTIALTTALFGDQEWAVRLASPLTHAAGAFFLMAFARRRWGAEAAVWTGVVYITMPAIWLSAGVISTDALLLPIWAGGLWALDRYLERQSPARALALGAFIGLGFLAKYAMIYFVGALALLAIFDRPSRRALVKPAALLTALVAVAGVLPNMIWNAQNDFATVSHTAANARWEAADLHFGELGEFVLDQLGVFGPITFGLLLWALYVIVRRRGGELGARGVLLAAFTIPPLAVVAFQAFISRAHANWAASAYVAASVLVAVWAIEKNKRAWLAAAVGLHVAVGVVFASAAIAPAFADQIGLANAFKRARGWPATVEAVREVYAGAEGEPYSVVMVDNRLLFHGIEYYARRDPLPLRMWLRFGGPVSHAENVAPITAADGGPVLVVSEREGDLPKIAADFEAIEPVGQARIELGGGKTRDLAFFAARGFEPLERGPEYEARWDASASERRE